MLLLSTALASSDRYEPSPVYTLLPDGSTAEVEPNLTSYIYATMVGIPVFIVVMSIPFIYHYCIDLKKTKHKHNWTKYPH